MMSNDLYLGLLHDLKSGLRPSQICKRDKISKQKLQYYITNLTNAGYIRKAGYGTWKLSKKAEIVTSTKVSRGTREAPDKIEMWRMGYRFLITHDNPIPDLKHQKLKNGGFVDQGRIMGCWITKGKETLDIYGSVARSNNLWDASNKALMEITACKCYLEDNYHLILDPLEMLKPDIVINTPETKHVAEKIYEEFGRIRSEFVDAGDSSKTGQPEYEAKSIKAAKNTLDNLSMVNMPEELLEGMKETREMMKGFVQRDLANQNTMMMLTTMFKRQTEILDNMSTKMSAPSYSKPDTVNQETGMSEEEIVEVEIEREIKDGFYGEWEEETRRYGPMGVGARIWLNRTTANSLIKSGHASEIRTAKHQFFGVSREPKRRGADNGLSDYLN